MRVVIPTNSGDKADNSAISLKLLLLAWIEDRRM